MFAGLFEIPEFINFAAAAAVIILALLAVIALLAAKNSGKKAQNAELMHQADGLARQNADLINQMTSLRDDNTRLKAQYDSLVSSTDDKIKYIEQSKKEMETQFRNISNEALRLQSAQINEVQKNSLGALLEPFRTQLAGFKEEISKANSENIKNKSSFDEQFKNLLQLNKNLSSDAQNLTDALRGSKKMQGDWGEVELYRLLEIAGLQRGTDFFTQENFKNEDNQNLRPDVVVRLPNNRGIIVDSKVSLNDYVNYVNAADEASKQHYLQQHVRCIKAHIDELSAKEYQKLLKEESLDYVVIFIPVESAFAAAVKEDVTLYDYAYKKNIALTTPSSLLPILRTVENLWQIENRNKYVQKIAETGGLLYDKLANFVSDMEKVRKALKTAQDNCDTAMNKLSRGRGNAVSLAERLKSYGAKTNKNIGLESDELLSIEDNTEEKAS